MAQTRTRVVSPSKLRSEGALVAESRAYVLQDACWATTPTHTIEDTTVANDISIKALGAGAGNRAPNIRERHKDPARGRRSASDR